MREEIGGRNPNCEKIPTEKMLPPSESAQIGGGNPNHEKTQLCITVPTCEKNPTVKTRSVGSRAGHVEGVRRKKLVSDLNGPTQGPCKRGTAKRNQTGHRHPHPHPHPPI